MKDRQGQVIGFEKLSFLPPTKSPVRTANVTFLSNVFSTLSDIEAYCIL